MPHKSKLSSEDFEREIFVSIKFRSLFCSATLTPKKIFSVKAVWSCEHEFERVGDSSFGAKEEQQIAYLISSVFPEFLNRSTLTPPQLEELLHHHDQSVCLAATISGEKQDILKTKKVSIPSKLQDFYEKDANYIKHLFYLIKNNWVELKNLLKIDFGVSCSSALVLFNAIIQIELLRRFSPCLSEYHSDIRRFYRQVYNIEKNLLKKNYSQKEKAEKAKQCDELWNKLNIKYSFIWSATIDCLELIALANTSLRKDIDRHDKLLAKLFSYQERICYEGKDEYAKTWYKGVAIPGAVARSSIEHSIWWKSP